MQYWLFEGHFYARRDRFKIKASRGTISDVGQLDGGYDLLGTCFLIVSVIANEEKDLPVAFVPETLL